MNAGGMHEFSVSDDVGTQNIAEFTGFSVDTIKPRIPQYIPPGSGIGSSLFELPGSFGGRVPGLVFGSWLGQKKQISTT